MSGIYAYFLALVSLVMAGCYMVLHDHILTGAFILLMAASMQYTSSEKSKSTTEKEGDCHE